MIEVSKLNGDTCVVNADSIDVVETIPDTVLVLASGKKLLVLDTPEEILEKIVYFKQRIFLGLPKKMEKKLAEEKQLLEKEQQTKEEVSEF